MTAAKPTAHDATRATIRNISVLAYAQGFTQWHYRSADHTIADVLAPGFFAVVADAGMVEHGDHILFSVADGGGSAILHKAGGVVVALPMVHAAYPAQQEAA